MSSFFLQSWATFAAFFSVLFGLLFGSFGNVVIFRVPNDESIVSPPSHCPNCDNPIAWYDNIPVVSWLILGAKCRNCKEPISWRYPLIEAITGLAWGWTAWWFASHGDFWALAPMLLFTWLGIVVSMIDLDTRRIPNALTYTLTPVMAVLVVAAALLNGEPQRAINAGIGAFGAFAFLMLLFFASKGKMGMGDIKYAPMLGMVLGYVSLGSVIIGFFGAFLIGSIVSVGLMVTKIKTRKDMVPFGPFLSLGTWVALFAGPYLWGLYASTLS